MCVLKPVKLVITNYPEGQSEEFEGENNPNRPEDGTRKAWFTRDEAQELQKKAKKACLSEGALIRLLIRGYEPYLDNQNPL